MSEHGSSRATVSLLMAAYFPMLILISLFAVVLAIVIFVWASEFNFAWSIIMLPGFWLLGIVGQLGYSARVLFQRRPSENPHEVEVPRKWLKTLYLETEKLAEKYDTPMPDEIRLHPLEISYVYETEMGERILVLGGVGLAALSRKAFLGVIAHELGHFAGGDTALARRGARWLLMMAMVEHEFAQHPSNWLNPLAWMVRGYHLLFRVVWASHSREQEYLADEYEADQVGETQAARTLILLHALDHLPWAQLSSIVEYRVNTRTAAEKIFAEQAKRIRQTTEKEWVEATQIALRRKPKKEDTHPTLKARVVELGLHKEEVLKIAATLGRNPGTARKLVDEWDAVEKMFSRYVTDLVERIRADKYEAAQVFLGRPLN